MLKKLDSYVSHIMTNIKILVSAYYVFCKGLEILRYIADLLYKIKFFCNNTQNLNNRKKCCKKNLDKLTKLYFYRFKSNFESLLLLMLLSAFFKRSNVMRN